LLDPSRGFREGEWESIYQEFKEYNFSWRTDISLEEVQEVQPALFISRWKKCKCHNHLNTHLSIISIRLIHILSRECKCHKHSCSRSPYSPLDPRLGYNGGIQHGCLVFKLNFMFFVNPTHVKISQLILLYQTRSHPWKSDYDYN